MRDAHYVVIDTLETRVSVDTNVQVNIYKNASFYNVTHWRPYTKSRDNNDFVLGTKSKFNLYSNDNLTYFY